MKLRKMTVILILIVTIIQMKMNIVTMTFCYIDEDENEVDNEVENEEKVQARNVPEKQAATRPTESDQVGNVPKTHDAPD